MTRSRSLWATAVVLAAVAACAPLDADDDPQAGQASTASAPQAAVTQATTEAVATASATGGAAAGHATACDGGPELHRLARGDRVATAVAVSAQLWPSAGEVVLASGTTFADGLSAGALAAQRDAPLLITYPDRLPATVAAEIERLRAATVTIAGGPAAVSEAVAAAAARTTNRPRVVRLAGADRYATSAAVANAAGAPPTGEAAIVSGTAFADAVAAGALAATPERLPTLLTTPDRLHEAARRSLQELGASRVVVVGGPRAVSDAVVRDLETGGFAVTRLAGGDRYATSAAVARAALARFPAQGAVFATGSNFPDALAAIPAAARTVTVVALAPPDDLDQAPDLRRLLQEHHPQLRCNRILGGSAAIGVGVAEQLAALLSAPPPDDDPVLVGAGDIAACGTKGDEATAALLDRVAGMVATFGDNVYERGSPAEFADCYHPSWGRHRHRTRPSVGNHEYLTAGAAGYFGYFGARAGRRGEGWYSYDLGPWWHVVVLNSNCGAVGCAHGSAQERWLRADLAANRDRNVVAYWHHARFSSGRHGNTTSVAPLWQALYDERAELILSGHDHSYERFALTDPAGRAAPGRGVRQFVVGTGGRSHYRFERPPLPATEVRDDTSFGVLVLTLGRDRYTWRFVPAGTGSFTDHGSAPVVP